MLDRRKSCFMLCGKTKRVQRIHLYFFLINPTLHAFFHSLCFWEMCRVHALKFMPAQIWCALDVIKQTDFHHLMIIFTQGDGEQPTYPLRLLSLKGNAAHVYQCVIKVHGRLTAARIVLMQSDIEDEQSGEFSIPCRIIIVLKYLHNVSSIIFAGACIKKSARRQVPNFFSPSIIHISLAARGWSVYGPEIMPSSPAAHFCWDSCF